MGFDYRYSAVWKVRTKDRNADPDPAFHFNAVPDPAFHLSADPDPDPAPPQNDVNLRPLLYCPPGTILSLKAHGSILSL